jgi:hypothetical protein
MLETEREGLRGVGEREGRHRAAGSGAIKTVASRLYVDWLIPVALVVGVFLRTREWLFDKSLWLDELMVTYSITHRDFAGLARPLSLDQAAPVGWLWLEHASIHVFGMSDLALRFPDWAASLVALGVFPVVARWLIGRWAAPAATVVFATGPKLIYYAAETKQYGFDVTCVLLALLVTAWLARSRPTFGRAAVWGLVCAVLVWFSQPAILVCAVCGLVLLVLWFRSWDTLLAVVAGGLILGMSVALDYAVALKVQSANTQLKAFWRMFGGYPPLDQTASTDLHWLRVDVANNSHWLNLSHPWLLIGLMACGLVVVALSRRQLPALLLGLPLAVALGMAVTDQYPMSGRLTLYLYPIVVMLAAAPISLAERRPDQARPDQARPDQAQPDQAQPDQARASRIARWSRPAAALASVAVLATVAVPGIAQGLDKAAHPDDSASVRQAIAFASEHQRPGDLVVGQGLSAILALGFYGPHYHIWQRSQFGLWPADRDGRCADPFSTLRGVTRIWLITGELASGQPLNRNQIFVSSMTPYAKLVLSYNGVGAAGAYLFEVRGSRTHEARPVDPALAMDCPGIRSLPSIN